MADPTIKDLAYRGLASVLGGPVDLATMVMRPFGYNVPEQQVVGGSEWIGKQLEDVGLVSSARAPLQEFITSMAIPTPSGLAKGAALGGAALVGAVKSGGKTTEVLKNMKIDSAKNPLKKGYERLFHAGSDPVQGGFFEKVPSGGTFDGFFSLPGRYGAYGTGAKYYADIKQDKILKNYELNYDLPYEKVAEKLEKISGKNKSDDDFDTLWKAVVEDESDRVSDDLIDILKVDDVGEAQWEAQRLRGRLAKELGYDAVEMSDENGTSYLLTSGTNLMRDVD